MELEWSMVSASPDEDSLVFLYQPAFCRFLFPPIVAQTQECMQFRRQLLTQTGRRSDRLMDATVSGSSANLASKVVIP